jgi:hypothetical protein
MSAQRARPAAPARNPQLQHVWCAALDGMLSGGARRAPQICTPPVAPRTARGLPTAAAGPGRAAQRQLLLLLLNGGCGCGGSTVAAAAAAWPGRAARRVVVAAAQRWLLVLVLLCCCCRAGPGQARPCGSMVATTAALRRRAVRGATNGVHICGARARALRESTPSSAARHTCCSCALRAGAAGRARCADTAHDPQRTARAVATAPLAFRAGSALGGRRRVYPARGVRYKCTIGFLQRMVVSALHAAPAARPASLHVLVCTYGNGVTYIAVKNLCMLFSALRILYARAARRRPHAHP